MLTHLRAQGSRLPVEMLTGHGDAQTAFAALTAGASDLIEKPVSAAALVVSVRQATVRRPGRPGGRERGVLVCVLVGATNKSIAATLGLDQRTVENHRAVVMRKTGAASLPELVRLALLAGIQPG